MEAPSDACASRAVAEALERGEEPPPVRLTGGDLWRTLGGRPNTSGTRSVSVVPVDLGKLATETIERPFVAHVVAGHRWWGRLVVVMNAEWYGERIVAPGAHPGDGLLDVLEVDLGIRQRLEALRRSRSGTHLPHPGISYSKRSSVEVVFSRPVPVLCDGIRMGRHRKITAELGGTKILVAV